MQDLCLVTLGHIVAGIPPIVLHPILMDLEERNEAIVAMAQQLPPLALEDIGLRFGLTRERVRQILAANRVVKQRARMSEKVWSDCAVCGRRFERRRKNKRKTCSRACADAAKGSASNEDLLAELARLSPGEGRAPRQIDMIVHGAYDHTTYYRRFGSWRAACVAAGLSPNYPNRAFGGVVYEDARAE